MMRFDHEPTQPTEGNRRVARISGADMKIPPVEFATHLGEFGSAPPASTLTQQGARIETKVSRFEFSIRAGIQKGKRCTIPQSTGDTQKNVSG